MPLPLSTHKVSDIGLTNYQDRDSADLSTGMSRPTFGRKLAKRERGKLRGQTAGPASPLGPSCGTAFTPKALDQLFALVTSKTDGLLNVRASCILRHVVTNGRKFACSMLAWPLMMCALSVVPLKVPNITGPVVPLY